MKKFFKLCLIILIACNNMLGNNVALEDKTEAIEFCIQKWQLEDVQKIVYDSCVDNYVAIAYSNLYQKKVVLKICSVELYSDEKRSLEYFQPTGAVVDIISTSDEHRALLLEYLPGPTLSTYFPNRDDEAVYILADLIKKIYIKKILPGEPHRFATLQIWFDPLFTYQVVHVPPNLVERARVLLPNLVSTQKDLYVLHGDLHHNNIMYNGTNWVAMDSCGVVAELEFEVISFIIDPLPELLQQKDPVAIIEHRIDLLSTIFGFDKQRIWQWLFVSMTNSSCWMEIHSTNSEVTENCIQLAAMAHDRLS